MKTPHWIKKSTANIQAFNASLSQSERVLHASKAGKARWAKMTEEQKVEHLKKMREARK